MLEPPVPQYGHFHVPPLLQVVNVGPRTSDGRHCLRIVSGKNTPARPHLRIKDVCKCDLSSLDIDPNTWEDLAQGKSSWRQTGITGLEAGEEKLRKLADDKRARSQNSCIRLQVHQVQQRLPLPCVSLMVNSLSYLW